MARKFDTRLDAARSRVDLARFIMTTIVAISLEQADHILDERLMFPTRGSLKAYTTRMRRFLAALDRKQLYPEC